MAREKHIVDLTIGNFKRFADFEVKNLGQFNLIVGDNNTGKTSFLEALLFDEDKNIFFIINVLSTCLTVMSNADKSGLYTGDYLYENFNFLLNKKNTLKQLILSIKNNNFQYDISLKKPNTDISYLSSLEKDKILLPEGVTREFILTINGLSKRIFFPEDIDNKHYTFVPFGVGHDEHLIDYYSTYIDVNKPTIDQFVEGLQVLIPKVNNVIVEDGVINIYEEGMNTPMPLFTYGEGANKLFKILCEVAMNEGKRLMIDEIDAGIHYSRFKSFWRTIMQAAKAYDVQIFATTHNIECVEYFREVLEEETMQEYQDLARIVSLKVKEDNSVKARVYNYEYMEYAKDANRELRGGGL